MLASSHAGTKNPPFEGGWNLLGWRFKVWLSGFDLLIHTDYTD